MIHLNELKDFCRPDCDRCEFLRHWFDHEEIDASLIRTGDLRHFLIRPGGEKCYNSNEYLKTLTAHYDRFPGAPGANDNGAAVFQLLHLCQFLKEGNYPHNCQILLTDGEEITRDMDRKEQGSYRLAELFKKRGLDRTVIVILDMCGIGDTMIYSTGMEKLTGKISEREEILLAPLIKLIPTYSRGKSIHQTERFSDDLGFMAHNFVTLQISLIPWKERDLLLEEKLPDSWQTMHTPWDSVAHLENYSFRIMEAFLKALSKVIIHI